ncbi:MAG: transcriptional regulator [Ottowia sp.]|uniref:transcriptional regulator n=1 Tax=Ottowia sp. TaxID=1898956 RepID=UPI0039E4F003
MLTVIETEEFIAWAARVWSDEEREEFIGWIAQNPDAGDVMPGATPLRKVRWSRAGMGKRGGARVIYFNYADDGVVVLLLVYAKAKFDNISSHVLKAIKEKFDAKYQNPRP